MCRGPCPVPGAEAAALWRLLLLLLVPLPLPLLLLLLLSLLLLLLLNQYVVRQARPRLLRPLKLLRVLLLRGRRRGQGTRAGAIVRRRRRVRKPLPLLVLRLVLLWMLLLLVLLRLVLLRLVCCGWCCCCGCCGWCWCCGWCCGCWGLWLVVIIGPRRLLAAAARSGCFCGGFETR